MVLALFLLDLQLGSPGSSLPFCAPVCVFKVYNCKLNLQSWILNVRSPRTYLPACVQSLCLKAKPSKLDFEIEISMDVSSAYGFRRNKKPSVVCVSTVELVSGTDCMGSSQDPDFYVLTEDKSPCIFGPVEKQRWSYACAKQLIERVIYAESAENGLEFTIVRPFNWIGPRMDFIPGVDGPTEGVPRVLACFSNNLLRGEPLKLVDGGVSQRTFVYIKDAIEAVLLMIENPDRANGQIFNVGNPNNEVTVRELAELMTEIYSKVSEKPKIEVPTIDVSSKEFYGEGYDDSDKRIPDMTIIKRQLGWEPCTSLPDLLQTTLTYQHQTYANAVKQAMSKSVGTH